MPTPGKIVDSVAEAALASAPATKTPKSVTARLTYGYGLPTACQPGEQREFGTKSTAPGIEFLTTTSYTNHAALEDPHRRGLTMNASCFRSCATTSATPFPRMPGPIVTCAVVPIVGK